MANKMNNPVIQALLDLKKYSDNKDLIDKLLNEDLVALQKAGDEFDKHQYPDKSIKYGRMTTYKQNAAMVNLNRENQAAAALFNVLCGICISPTNDIAVPMNELKELTGMSKNTLISAREKLLDSGFIATVKQSTNRQAAIYRINPTLYGVGKPKSPRDEHDFWDYARLGSKHEFERLSRPDYIVTSNGMVDSDNKFLKPTSLTKDTSSERADTDEFINTLAEALKTKKPKRTKNTQGS